MSEPVQYRKTGPSTKEKALSALILGLLVMTAITLFTVQFHFDPAQWRAQPDDGTPAPAAMNLEKNKDSINLAVDLPLVQGLQPMTPPENYDPITLSDKIDGKAELYLSAGFVHMHCRRLALVSDSSLWMELFIYDMADYANGFAVYSRQRRSGAHPLELTPDAYRSANGIFLVHGPYYMEIIGSAPSNILQEKMIAQANAFILANPIAAAQLDERSLFPENGLVADSIALTPTNAFGLEGFDQVFTAQYQFNGHSATAFISRRSSSAEATALASTYTDFLITYGGQKRVPPAEAPPMALIEILDLYEIIFSRGTFIAGIREADDPLQGAQLAKQLYNRLTETEREP